MSTDTMTIDRWLAPPAPPERLALFRILVGGFVVAYLTIRLPVFLDLRNGRPSGFEPVGVLAGLNAPLESWLIVLMLLVALVAAVAFTAGLAFRAAGPALAVALLLLTTYRSSWGQLLHFENLMVLHVWVLVLSPAADAVAIGPSRPRTESARYGFPLRIAALVTVVTYVMAGVAKLRNGGLEWLVGDTLQNHIAYSAARLDLLGGTESPFAAPVVELAWFLPVLATATVVIELVAPIALWRRASAVWCVAAWAMHVGIAATMFIVFPYPLFGVAFAPFFRLERMWSYVRDMVRAGPVAPASS